MPSETDFYYNFRMPCGTSGRTGANYTFHTTHTGTLDTGNNVGDTGLQFTTSNDLYCISQIMDGGTVQHIKYEENYCDNPAVVGLGAWPSR